MSDKFKVIVDGEETISTDFDDEVIPMIENNLLDGKYLNSYTNDEEYAAIYEILSIK